MTTDDRAIWLEKRKKNIGASEAGALLGVSPWRTRYELWHIKAGLIDEEDLSENQRVFWGQKLEPAIASGVAEQKQWHIQKVHRYLEHPSVPGMAASLDYEILSHPNGPGALEIKSCDYLQWVGWGKKLPLVYEVQLQHQLAVIRRSWGAVGLLVGGNDLKVFVRERHDGVIDRLTSEVTLFWDSIAQKQPPAVDWEQDADTVIQLCQRTTESKVFQSDDPELVQLANLYEEAREVGAGAEREKKQLKAQLLQAIGDAEYAYIGPYKISAGTVSGCHVAAHDKPAYRGFRLNEVDRKGK